MDISDLTTPGAVEAATVREILTAIRSASREDLETMLVALTGYHPQAFAAVATIATRPLVSV